MQSHNKSGSFLTREIINKVETTVNERKLSKFLSMTEPDFVRYIEKLSARIFDQMAQSGLVPSDPSYIPDVQMAITPSLELVFACCYEATNKLLKIGDSIPDILATITEQTDPIASFNEGELSHDAYESRESEKTQSAAVQNSVTQKQTQQSKRKVSENYKRNK